MVPPKFGRAAALPSYSLTQKYAAVSRRSSGAAPVNRVKARTRRFLSEPRTKQSIPSQLYSYIISLFPLFVNTCQGFFAIRKFFPRYCGILVRHSHFRSLRPQQARSEHILACEQEKIPLSSHCTAPRRSHQRVRSEPWRFSPRQRSYLCARLNPCYYELQKSSAFLIAQQSQAQEPAISVAAFRCLCKAGENAVYRCQYRHRLR